MKNLRIRIIDNSKAIAILLVIVGHVYGLPSELVVFIFSFHLSIFFFLAGMLLKPEPRLKAKLGKVFFTTIGPYLMFFFLSYGYWLGTRKISKFDPAVSIWAPVLGLVSGRIEDLFVNPALWFLPCMFLSSTLAMIILKYVESMLFRFLVLASLICLSILIGPASGTFKFWTLGSVPMAGAFMLFGSLVRPYVMKLEHVDSFRVFRFLLACALTCLTWYVSALNPYVNWSEGNFGLHPFLFICTSISGSILVLLIGSLISTNRFFAWLAANTIVLFPTHLLVFNFFRGIGKVMFGMSVEGTRSYDYGLFAVPISIFFAFSITRFLYRLSPRSFPGLQR